MAVKQHTDVFEFADEPPRVMASRVGRVVYAAIGFGFLGLGIFGTITPGFPGTVFLLLSVWFFMRSNERMYHWVLDHPRFGRTIRAYHAGYGIPRRIKVYALAAMWISVSGAAVFTFDSATARVLLIGLAVVGTGFILTRPTTENVLAAQA